MMQWTKVLQTLAHLAVVFPAENEPAWRWLRLAAMVMACVPLVYYVVAMLAARRFFSRKDTGAQGDYTPALSVLKPVRGVDFASYENFRSFCLQDYPDYEILFCVTDLADAAVPLVQRLVEEFPQQRIRLLSGAPQLGSNGKVNNLVLLAKEARYELLVQSDGDVRVGRNYLKKLTSPFRDPEMGVVSCLYRGVTQANLWAETEALGVATDFSAGVLVANWMEGVTFALGASVAVTKKWLAATGGYEALTNVLADDYEIGNRVARAGGKVMVSQEIVKTMYPKMTFAEFWEHQSRWARTVRLCRPASYVGLLFTHGLPWACVGAAASGSTLGAGIFLAAYLLLRLAMARVVGVWGLRDESARNKWWLIPLRDGLHFAVWVGSFFSSRITWGDQEFRLKSNGEMVAVGRANLEKSR
jgi:ceramide glucosyltransferase